MRNLTSSSVSCGVNNVLATTFYTFNINFGNYPIESGYQLLITFPNMYMVDDYEYEGTNFIPDPLPGIHKISLILTEGISLNEDRNILLKNITNPGDVGNQSIQIQIYGTIQKDELRYLSQQASLDIEIESIYI